MRVIRGNNVNDIYNNALWLMKMEGKIGDSRNGKVMATDFPVTSVYHRPTERMLFDPDRDANPFFHMMEAVWMLAGRRDVKFPSQFASNIANYSDDGTNLNGAYGYRWRQHFGVDQVVEIIDHLKKFPNTRRAVLSMWDPDTDVEDMTRSKDVPCNTAIFFGIRDRRLDMMVTCRSNDIIWGCYGANVVHMSFLQEFVAQACGLKVGEYYQVSNNWHVYEKFFTLVDNAKTSCGPDWYADESIRTVDILPSPEWASIFLEECEQFVEQQMAGTFGSFQSQYFNWVMIPMAKAWAAYKDGNKDRAFNYCSTIKDDAVSVACAHWLARRKI